MNATPELAGRVAVVTGSARNIGRAIALELARAGAAVVVHARQSLAEAEAVAQEIRGLGGQAVVKLGDVTVPADTAGIVAAAIDAFGRLDILVNNAAIRKESAFANLDYKEWREVVGTILDGAFLLTQAALPALAQSGAGAVINIGGLSAHTGAAGRAHVVAAKSGLVGLTRALAHDLAPQGITVNCVAPGLIATERSRTAPPSPSHHAIHSTLIGRRGTPEEVAALVRYLCGPHARYITGQTVHANGGAFIP